MNVFESVARMHQHKSNVQLIWGLALLCVGIMVFFRIPQVMPRIEQIEHYARVLPYIKFCLYLMGAFLTAGGAMKLYSHYRSDDEPSGVDEK